MSLIRPEAEAQLRRWSGVTLGVAIAALGLWWAATGFGVTRWTGWGLIPLGGTVAWAAFQRARFGTGGGGVGVVTLREGEIAYFGPFTGGTADLSDVSAIGLDRRGMPGHWRIEVPGRLPLLIPEDAEGVEVLFDAFVTLPGLSVNALLAARRRAAGNVVVIWRRALDRLH